jgi:hypothetical protein
LKVSVEGSGEVVAQAVRRFNLPDVEDTLETAFDIQVDYDTTQVSVNDLITLSVEVDYHPFESVEAVVPVQSPCSLSGNGTGCGITGVLVLQTGTER